MIKKGNTLKIILLIIGDAILLFLALASGLAIRYYPTPDETLFDMHVIPFTILFFLWLVLFGAFGLYDLRLMKNSKIFFYRLLQSMAANTGSAIIIFYFLPFFEIEPRRNLLIIATLAVLFIFVWRFLFNMLIAKTPALRILFFGTGYETLQLVDYLRNNPQLGQKPVAFIINGEKPHETPPLKYFMLHSYDIKDIIRETRADTIVISSEIKENKTLAKILFQVIPYGIGVIEFTKLHEMLTGKIPLSLIGEIWFLENLVGIRRGTYEFFKRTIDIILAGVLLFPCMLLFPVIALAIKADSRGSIFFQQRRVGRHGRDFWLLKFRSMVADAERMSGFKGHGRDPRHTRVGAFLRKSYLDELPQIINILKGEMSFVGPRPERPEYVKILKEKIPFYEMRLLTLPGITGWAQVNMEDDASVEDTPEKMQYDLYYIKNRSPILDLLIIIRTLFAVLRRQGR